MKIIFLDIDGVLIRYSSGSKYFEKELADNLKQILEETGAKIIISSTRKAIMSGVETAFKKAGLDYNLVIGTTGPEFLCRAQSILDYVKITKIDKWIAIDDEKLHIPGRYTDDKTIVLKEENFVNTGMFEGLTKEKMQEAINKLK